APGLRDIPIHLQHAVDPIRSFDQLNAGGDYDFASVPSLLTQFAFPRASYSHLLKNLSPRLWKLGRQQRIRPFSDRFGFSIPVQALGADVPAFDRAVQLPNDHAVIREPEELRLFFQCVFGLLVRSHVRLDTVPDGPPIREPPRAGVEVDPANL